MNTAHKISLEMNEIGNRIREHLKQIAGKDIGFSLIIYTTERASYLSNIDRETAIIELKTLLALWEAGMPSIPAHEVS